MCTGTYALRADISTHAQHTIGNYVCICAVNLTLADCDWLAIIHMCAIRRTIELHDNQWSRSPTTGGAADIVVFVVVGVVDMLSAHHENLIKSNHGQIVGWRRPCNSSLHNCVVSCVCVCMCVIHLPMCNIAALVVLCVVPIQMSQLF